MCGALTSGKARELTDVSPGRNLEPKEGVMKASHRAVLWAILSVIAIPTRSQTSAGSIVGVVRDSSSAVAPGAKVTVTNLGTNVSFTYVTDDTGNYFVPGLIPGQYRVSVEKSGFKTVTVPDVVVAVNQTVRVDLTMPVGQVAETVNVAAEAPLIQADQATLGQVVNNRAVSELPLNGRDYTNLLRLNTGVTEVQGGITTAATIRRHGLNDSFRMVSVNGARPASVSYMIDGISTNEPLFQSPSIVPPIDVIQEFKLQNGLYSAEFGMGSAQVNVALKSGTNTLHGSLWEFLRNDALQPSHPRFQNKTVLKQNQFGLAAGAPLWIPRLYNGKDRTFFFFSYQGGRRRTGFNGQAQVPTLQQRNGDFSDWPTQLYNPLTTVPNPGGTPSVTRQPFANNQIPANLIAQQSKNLLRYFPQPNVNCAMPCLNFTRRVTQPTNTDGYSGRVDHNIGASDRLFGQILQYEEHAPLPSIIPLSGNDVRQHAWLANINWTHVFSPRTINEARVGFNRFWFLQGYETAFGGVNYWKEIGLTNLRDDPAYYAIPLVSLGTQYSSVGFGGTAPFFNISNVFSYVESLTLTRGRSSIKFGFDIRRNQNFTRSGGQGNGQLTFAGSYTARNPTIPQAAGRPDTGNGFADFLLGYLNNAGATATAFRAFDAAASRLRNTDYMLYYQHDVRATSRLTLNLGLRWELHTPFKDITKGGSIFDFGYPGGRLLYRDRAYTELVNNPILAACCASDTLIHTDRRNFAPRLGLAWRPLATNRFVVRAGYGIFYDVMHNYYPAGSISQNIPFLSPTLPTPTGAEAAPPLDIRNLFPPPYSISQRRFPLPFCQAPSQSIIDPATGINTIVQNFCPGAQTQLPDNKTPYNQQWALNLQFEPRPNLLLEVGYQGSHALREPIQWIFNQAYLPKEINNPNNSVTFRSECPPGTYPASCSPIEDRVPYGNFIRNAYANANILQSVYHAMTMKAEQRFSAGVQVLASFTWGRAIDQFSEIQNVAGAVSSIAQYAHRFDLERNASNFDQTRRVVLSWLWELPVGKGRHFLNRGGVVNAVLGGWQINGISTLADGTPFTVGCFCGDRAQIGNIYNVERMNVLGNPRPANFTPTYEKQFDTSVFATPALGTLGTGGRNILRSVGQRALDMSFFKNFAIKERANLQFRSEFFNLPSSHFYWPLFPNAVPTATNFGSLIPPGGDHGNLFNPRVIQFGLRMVF